MFLCIQLSLNSWNWYFSRSISYFEPLRIFNSIFGAILMKMNHISIVGQSRAIIGRRGSYQGLSPDSHNLWGTMSLSQPSKFHVLYIKPEKSYCWKMSFKRTKGPSGLHFHLGLTGVNFCFIIGYPRSLIPQKSRLWMVHTQGAVLPGTF